MMKTGASMRLAPLLACSALLACGSSSDAPAGGGASSNATCENRTRVSDGGTPAPATCQVPVGASALGADQVQAMGHVAVGQTIPFQVPAGTESVTIVQQAVKAPEFVSFQPSCTDSAIDLDNTAVPLTVKDPTGKVWYDDNPPSVPADVSTLLVFFASDSPGTGTLGFPNTSTGLAALGTTGLPAGTWQVQVSDYAYECANGFIPAGSNCSLGATDSIYDVTVITKSSAQAAIAAPTLNLDVYLVTTTSASASRPLPSASTAATDPDLARLVSTLRALLSGSATGIQLGAVTFHDVPQSVKDQYATGVDVDQTGSCAPLPQLFANATAGNTLNVFLVSGFKSATTTGSNQIVGVDGTIPGPASVGGSVASGVAVSTANLRFESVAGSSCSSSLPDFQSCGDDTTAYIIAHEGGHFMGLYHVVEATGTANDFDPLSDTPTCLCSKCAPAPSRARCADAPTPPASPYQLKVSDCLAPSIGCGSGDNLMFWLFGTGSRGTISPEQAHVMRTSPLLH
jgi:hypothetical protein